LGDLQLRIEIPARLRQKNYGSEHTSMMTCRSEIRQPIGCESDFRLPGDFPG